MSSPQSGERSFRKIFERLGRKVPNPSGVGTSVGNISMISYLIVLVLTPAKGHGPIGRASGPPTPHSNPQGKILVSWHGIEQVLRKAERCLEGTPFKMPVAVLNTLIEVKNVRCHSQNPITYVDPTPRLLQTIGTRSKTILTRLFDV